MKTNDEKERNALFERHLLSEKQRVIILKTSVAIHPVNDALPVKRAARGSRVGRRRAFTEIAVGARGRGSGRGRGGGGRDESRSARIDESQRGGGGRSGKQGGDSVETGLWLIGTYDNERW